MKLRVVFLGTPEFAVPSLKLLMADTNIEVVAVMTQPDKPLGRGQRLQATPIKEAALKYDLPINQSVKLSKDDHALSWLQNLAPDFIVTAAYGQILTQAVLDIPKYGVVNVHASLLPQYRGANPIQWALLNGETHTGVTTMLTELGVDTGPMLDKIQIKITPTETAGELLERLALVGAEILPSTLYRYATGVLSATPQDSEKATHARKLVKEDALIEWDQPAEKIHNKIRGQNPWPGTYTGFEQTVLKIHRSTPPTVWKHAAQFMKTAPLGSILGVTEHGIVIQTSTQPLQIEVVQPPNKPKMAARDWYNGLQKAQRSIVFETPVPA
jgi:methionyl-tRNA formyltransferase